MITRREDLGLVFVGGLGAFRLGALRASRDPKGGLNLFDEARGRYLFVRQPPARFGALTDGEALRWLNAQIEAVSDFAGYGFAPAGTFNETLTEIIGRVEGADLDYAGLFSSALETL